MDLLLKFGSRNGTTMTPTPSQLIRQQIREAEGYLELGSMFDDQWSLNSSLKAVMADSALFSLQKIDDPRGHFSHIRYLQGQACRMSRRYADAIAYYVESLDRDPENLHTLLAIAWCYKRSGQLEAAIDAMQQATLYDPDSAIAFYNLACYFALENDIEGCLASLKVAFQLEPGFRVHLADEPDFDPVREHPAFQALASVSV